MTASHQLTPSQARFMQEAKERRQRLASKAKPDKPLVCLSASARAAAFEPPVIKLLPAVVEPETPAEWAERQIQRYRPWFVIESEMDAPTTIRPTIGIIQRSVCRYFGLTLTAMLSASRQAKTVYARHLGMFLSKELTLKSLPEIGRMFGDRDHTTVLHGVRKIARAQEQELEVAQDLAELRSIIKGCL